MHRQFADELASWLKDAPTFDPFRYFIDMAGNRVPFTKTKGQPMAMAYGAKRVPTNLVFIDRDVTWPEDDVRRLLADRLPITTGVLSTQPGILQVQDLNIDLA